MMAIHECGHCGNFHSGACPRVKTIEYWPDGTVKQVEYHGQYQDFVGPKDPTNMTAIPSIKYTAGRV